MRYRPLTVSVAAILCILSGPASADGYTLFDPGDSIATFPRAMNASGVVAGYYEDGAFVDHGFARAGDGTIMHALERLLPFVAQHVGYRLAVTHVPGVTW